MSTTDPRRARRAVWLVLGALAVLGLAATVARAQQADPQDRTLIREGLKLFGQTCATCHGADGGGIPDVAPDIRLAPPALVDFVIRTGRMPLPTPDARVVRRDPLLTAEQRRAIVAYWRTVTLNPRPDIPDVDLDVIDLAAGREAYEENCIACHSAFGAGIAISERDIAPSLHAASPVEIAEATRVGPGVMPLFSEDQIPEEELNALIGYVLTIRDRPKPGGFTIGRSGPVTEGLVSWTGGVLVLLLAAYLIGERRAD